MNYESILINLLSYVVEFMSALVGFRIQETWRRAEEKKTRGLLTEIIIEILESYFRD